jgi:hypothetical protein
LEEILNELDKILQAAFSAEGLKAYGLCEQIQKDSKPVPVSVDVTRKEAAIHDSFNGIFYHRILPGTDPVTEDEEMSFGATLKKRFAVHIRTVVAAKVRLGENFKYDFANAFPGKITTLSDYKFVFLNQLTLVDDHEGVYNQEYGPNLASYPKHRISWNIFALEYDLDFMLC